MSNPTVSVVIPAYNTAQYIADTLASVLAQTFTDYEILVVNDGSPDTPALEAALAPYRDRIRYIVQENRGLSGARNTAVGAATGDYLALLDSDDVWEPDYLEYQLAELRRRPELTAVYPNSVAFGDPQRAGKRYMDLHPSSGPVTFESLITQKVNVMVSVLIRRDAVVAAGLFDEALRSSEDFDLWLRIVRSGGQIGYHRRALVRSRLRPESLSANGISMCQHIVFVLDKVRGWPELTEAQRDLLAARRAHYAAWLRFHQGKRAFFEGDRGAALAALTEANVHLRSVKLSISLLLLRLTPGLLRRAYDLRDRVVFRATSR